ncbi:MAG: NAD(+)/NADH kinase [Ruminococcaceae bacterium]|nr:NAD(+)/NADH kinase [Oscillospiraceae bacterium]
MKKIAIIPNHTKDIGLNCTKKLIEALQNQAELYMNRIYQGSGLPVNYAGDELYDFVDAVVILGGDGTILEAAEPCAERGIPIMGINLGTVGFMTEIETEQIPVAAQRLLDGDYQIEERMMLGVRVLRDNNVSEYIALNDVVISKPDAEMVSLEMYCNEEQLNAYTADGVIIATPTGSTAYSLSAGGPVADPTMELFIATPICAHSLSSRPALVSAKKTIQLRLTEAGNTEAVVTIDGKIRERISCGEKVEVTKAKQRVKLIKMGNQSFYHILTSKLS